MNRRQRLRAQRHAERPLEHHADSHWVERGGSAERLLTQQGYRPLAGLKRRIDDVTLILMTLCNMTCPRCFGRGYLPEKRRPSKRNPHGNGFYARTCPRCRGTGSCEPKPCPNCGKRHEHGCIDG